MENTMPERIWAWRERVASHTAAKFWMSKKPAGRDISGEASPVEYIRAPLWTSISEPPKEAGVYFVRGLHGEKSIYGAARYDGKFWKGEFAPMDWMKIPGRTNE